MKGDEASNTSDQESSLILRIPTLLFCYSTTTNNVRFEEQLGMGHKNTRIFTDFKAVFIDEITRHFLRRNIIYKSSPLFYRVPHSTMYAKQTLAQTTVEQRNEIQGIF